MTHRSFPKSWAVLPALGLLTFPAIGCHSEAPAPEPSASTSLTSAPLPTPVAAQVMTEIPTAPPADLPPLTPTIPGLSATDVGPDRADPFPGTPPVDPSVQRVAAEVKQTAREIESTPASAKASAPAQATAKGIRRAADAIKAEAGKTASEIATDVDREAGLAVDRLQKDGLDATRRSVPDSLKSLQKNGQEAVDRGLKRARADVAKEIDNLTPGR